ncbi:MAG: DUF4386 domain-containing protein [Cyclobacteriaceae bacterium]
MTSTTSERIIGVLYLLAMASSIVGFSMLETQLGSPDYLSVINGDNGSFTTAILFHLVNDISVVAMGILMFSLIKKYHETVATTILTTRLMEGAILVAGKMGLLLLLTISKQYAEPGSAAEYYTTLGTLAKKWNAWSFEMAMLALGIGGFTLNYLLFTRRLVPVIFSLLGMVGYVLLFTKSVMAIIGTPAPFYMFMPVFFFEVTFPFWLIVKGLERPIVKLKNPL